MEERKTLHFERLSDPRRRASRRFLKRLFLTLAVIAVGALAIYMLAAYVYGLRVSDLVQVVETKVGLNP